MSALSVQAADFRTLHISCRGGLGRLPHGASSIMLMLDEAGFLGCQQTLQLDYLQVFLRKLDSTLDQLARMCCSTKAALELLPALGGIETGG